MTLRPRASARRRQPRGFTLLVAMGLVTLVTMTVLLSLNVVSEEADVQGDSRRQKEAFFAAEAALAEGREAVRLRLGDRQTYGFVLTSLGPAVNEPGLGDAMPAWYEVLPVPPTPPDTVGWNYLRLTPEDMPPSELANATGDAYADYPAQSNVRYRAFIRDDADDNSSTIDSNGQVWLIGVGEVLNPEGRPTRAIVQALITNENAPVSGGPGCINRGCGPDNTFNNSQDQRAPDISLVRTFR